MLKIETQDDGGAAFYSAVYSPERVWLCDSCERAPAEFLCKADSASLCAACDTEIHSANPLARRHHRVPIQPVPGPLYGDEDEAASWLLLNPLKNGGDERGPPPFFGGEVDEYLDLDEYATCQNNQSNEGSYDGHNQVQQHYGVAHGGDSVVPIKYQEGKNQHHCFQMGVDGGFGHPASVSQSVSVSSMEVGVVPESTSEVSLMSHTRTPKGTIELFSSPQIQVSAQLSPMDREARVLRYREKKKNRKFEKTIRYASRKAYAETRPRIKGRFAKRRDAEVEVDQMFADTIYGVVPSF